MAVGATSFDLFRYKWWIFNTITFDEAKRTSYISRNYISIRISM